MPVKKSVKGIVHDQGGNPVADAIVMVTGSAHPMQDIASSSDDQGQFYLDNLELPGSYTIQINHEGKIITKTISLQQTDSVFTIQL
ncbi:MAG: carboxypeptidase regulatory-like domain-containing protein [Chitinophagaceae bacterium]